MEQLPRETNEQALSSTILNLSSLINFYLPTDLVSPTKSKIFEMLLDLLKN
jgi:hypothetical protein